MQVKHAVELIQKVFDDMDKDFTIWEYRQEIKTLLQCGKFVEHIENHFKGEHPEWKVKCKICGKTIEEINKIDF